MELLYLVPVDTWRKHRHNVSESHYEHDPERPGMVWVRITASRATAALWQQATGASPIPDTDPRVTGRTFVHPLVKPGGGQ